MQELKKIKGITDFMKKKGDLPPFEDVQRKAVEKTIELINRNWHLKVMLPTFVLCFNKF